MNNQIAVNIKELPNWAKECIYSYAGNNKIRPDCTIKVTEKVTVMGDNGEGHYLYSNGKVKSIRSGYSENLISSDPIQQLLGFGANAPLKEGQFYLNVRHYYAGGSRYIVTLYVNPADMSKLLPEKIELTDNEKIILKCTASYKSSYANIRDYRLYEARREGFNGDIEIVRAELRRKGLLDKRNAITVKGRNAINRVDKMITCIHNNNPKTCVLCNVKVWYEQNFRIGYYRDGD